MLALPANTSATPSHTIWIAVAGMALAVIPLFMLVFHWKSFRTFILAEAADLVWLVWLLAGRVGAIATAIIGLILVLKTRGPGLKADGKKSRKP